jgi:hypothetical protein
MEVEMNVKPGDLAIIVNDYYGDAAGKICKVLELNKLLALMGDPIWKIELQTPSMTNEAGLQTIVACPDSWLRPVSGIPEVDFDYTDVPSNKELENV